MFQFRRQGVKGRKERGRGPYILYKGMTQWPNFHQLGLTSNLPPTPNNATSLGMSLLAQEPQGDIPKSKPWHSTMTPKMHFINPLQVSFHVKDRSYPMHLTKVGGGGVPESLTPCLTANFTSRLNNNKEYIDSISSRVGFSFHPHSKEQD